jgi:hypothetical protein
MNHGAGVAIIKEHYKQKTALAQPLCACTDEQKNKP